MIECNLTNCCETVSYLQSLCRLIPFLEGPKGASSLSLFCTTWVPLVLLLLCNGMHGQGPFVHPLAVWLYQLTIKKKRGKLSPDRPACEF
jgi:hypothetical protein